MFFFLSFSLPQFHFRSATSAFMVCNSHNQHGGQCICTRKGQYCCVFFFHRTQFTIS